MKKPLTKLKSLEEITLYQNGITWKGAVALANCFKVNPNLRVINLNDNILTEKERVEQFRHNFWSTENFNANIDSIFSSDSKLQI